MIGYFAELKNSDPIFGKVLEELSQGLKSDENSDLAHIVLLN
jgi:hypothetical protein